jgi:hypothetical protein
MTLIQELMNQAAKGSLLNIQNFKRFTPTEIRESIQTLVATEQTDLANALGDAGLSLYPNSEDMLAINGLLAIMREDWSMGVELLTELKELQGENTQAFTYLMLVRALRCNLDPAQALMVVREGLEFYPEQTELIAESLDLEGFSDAMMASGSAH